MSARIRGVVLAVAALTLAWGAWRDISVRLALGERQAVAARGGASDPRIALRAVDPLRLLSGTLGKEEARSIAALTRGVLTDYPLDAPALRDLALAERAQDPALMRERLMLAQRVSRRDLFTQLALLDYAIQHGDYETAFTHVDRIITVEPQTAATLFAPLTAFLVDPRARDVLGRYAQRPWYRQYLAQALASPPVAGDAAQMLLSAKVDLSGEGDAALGQALRALSQIRRHDLARKVALSLGKAEASVFDDFALTDSTLDQRFAPYSWKLAGQWGRSDFVSGQGLRVTLEPNRPTTVLERLTTLPPGRYELVQSIGEVDAATSPVLGWTMSCEEAGVVKPTWKQAVPVSSAQQRFGSVLSVPQGCAAQRWRFTALSDEHQTPVSFRIASLALKRTN